MKRFKFRNDRPLLKSAGWLVSSNIVVSVITIVKAILMAKYLGPDVYGVFGVLVAATALFTKFLEVRSGDAVIKFVSLYLKEFNLIKARGIFNLALLLDFIAALLIFMLIFSTSDLISEKLAEGKADTGLINLYALHVIIGFPMSACRAIIKLNNSFKYLAIIDAFAQIFQLLIVLILPFINDPLDYLIWSFLSIALIQTISLVIAAQRSQLEDDLFKFSWIYIKALKSNAVGLFRFIFSSSLLGTLKGVQSNADILLIGYLLGTTDAGLYKFAKNISQAATVATSPFYQVAFPEIIKLWNSRKIDKLLKFVRKFMLYSFIIGVGIFAIAFMVGPWLINSLMDPMYSAALNCLYILLVSVIIHMTIQYGHLILLSMNKPISATTSYMIGVGLQFGSAILLMPNFQLVGAAYSMVVFSVSWGVAMLIYNWVYLIRMKNSEGYLFIARKNQLPM